MSWFQIRYRACAGFSDAARSASTSSMKAQNRRIRRVGAANGSRPVNWVRSRNSRTLSFSLRASQPRRKIALMLSKRERGVGVEAERGDDLAELGVGEQERGAQGFGMSQSFCVVIRQEIAEAVVGERSILLQQAGLRNICR